MTTPTPTVGRIVHVLANPMLNNGADVAPAIITRVWNDTCVNVRVLYDGNTAPEWRTSVLLHAERPTNPEHPGSLAFWPPRV